VGSHYAGTETELRALNAYIKLARAADSVNARTTRHLAGAGLTASQFGVLEALHHLGPLAQSRLAAKHLMSRGNMTTVVENLEKRGLVRRERDARDRRGVTVRLLPAGEALLLQVLARHVAGIVADLSVLTPDEQDELGRLCRKLGKQDREPDGGTPR
jgi:MarR family 2-MHQ and catechol resistance regulon transcriptional repressor